MCWCGLLFDVLLFRCVHSRQCVSHVSCYALLVWQAFVTPEKLVGAEAWHCPKCKRSTESKKEMSIFRGPNALVRRHGQAWLFWLLLCVKCRQASVWL